MFLGNLAFRKSAISLSSSFSLQQQRKTFLHIKLLEVSADSSAGPDDRSVDFRDRPESFKLNIVHQEISGLHQLVDLLQQFLLLLPILVGLVVIWIADERHIYIFI